MTVTQRDIEEAFTGYLERGEREPWERVLAAIRAGQIVVEVTANRMTLIAKTHPHRAAFADRLSRLREESGLTHQQVADATELSLSAVNRNMGGQALTQWPLVAIMVRVMGGDPDDFRLDYDRARSEPVSEGSAPRKRRIGEDSGEGT